MLLPALKAESNSVLRQNQQHTTQSLTCRRKQVLIDLMVHYAVDNNSLLLIVGNQRGGEAGFHILLLNLYHLYLQPFI